MQKGQSFGSNLCLGYVVGEDKKFHIDPATAPTVKLIYDLYAQGKTSTEIVETFIISLPIAGHLDLDFAELGLDRLL